MKLLMPEMLFHFFKEQPLKKQQKDISRMFLELFHLSRE